jgi:hypothetical protein
MNPTYAQAATRIARITTFTQPRALIVPARVAARIKSRLSVGEKMFIVNDPALHPGLGGSVEVVPGVPVDDCDGQQVDPEQPSHHQAGL